MEMLSADQEMILEATDRRMRPLKRNEYLLLAKEGCFEDERVELLFGMVVPMSPPEPPHRESVRSVHEALLVQLKDRANVYCQTTFSASDDSVPEPDVYVTAPGRNWTDHHERSWLVVEVSATS